jgi:peptidoglycan/LPS O-acetylase OafA/YrhL
VAPLLRVLLIKHVNPLSAYILMPAQMDSLFAGVLVAWMMRSKPHAAALERYRFAFWIALGVLLCGAVVLTPRNRGLVFPWTQTFEYSWMACLYFVMLVLVVTARVQKPWVGLALRPLCWAGIGSYSLYLFHYPIRQVVSQFYTGATVGMIALISFVLVSILAFVSWHLIEKHMIALGHRLFAYEPPRSAVTPFSASGEGDAVVAPPVAIARHF